MRRSLTKRGRCQSAFEHGLGPGPAPVIGGSRTRPGSVGDLQGLDLITRGDDRDALAADHLAEA